MAGRCARSRDRGSARTRAQESRGPLGTIANLSHQVGVSRTRFVERFRHFLGEPPMAYLNRWRLKLAAETLISSNANVAEIAAQVGYASEAAFNRAFKREF